MSSASVVLPSRFVAESGTTYVVGQIVGVGGTAVVAEVTGQSTTLVVKVLSGHRYPVTEQSKHRFVRESRLLASVRHPNVVRILDFAQVGGMPALIMERCAGGSLYLRLQQERPTRETALQYLDWMLQGVAALHASSIVHRDITPKNLLLRSPSGPLVVSDLGAGRRLDDPTITDASTQLGSLIYIAPEQFAAAHAADYRSDVYSIGQVAFQLLTGVIPQGNTGALRAHEPAIPAEIAKVVDGMRAFSVAERPPDAGAAMREFTQAVSAYVARTASPSPPWRAVLAVIDELKLGPDEVATTASAVERPSLPFASAERLHEQIRSACLVTYSYLQVAVDEGRRIREIASREQLREVDEASIPLLRTPEVETEYWSTDEFATQQEWLACTKGCDELLRCLRDWRAELVAGTVWLLPASLTSWTEGALDGDSSVETWDFSAEAIQERRPRKRFAP